MLARSYRRALLAQNKSPRTVQAYGEAVRLFGEFLVARGMPTNVADITREHVELFIADLLARWKPATAHNRYRSLTTFFRWLAEEGEIPVSPMARMKPPAVPETPPDVLAEEQIRALLKACGGKAFEDARDTAIIRLFFDTGMRRAELAALATNALDLEANAVTVLGKGRRPRLCVFGRKTALALDRYGRARARHKHAGSPRLWITRLGEMTDNGVYQMICTRAEQAGIGKIHPHQLRHTFAHAWLATGGQEGDLMRLAGWKSRDMLSRYGASAADARAHAAYQTRSPGDRL